MSLEQFEEKYNLTGNPAFYADLLSVPGKPYQTAAVGILSSIEGYKFEMAVNGKGDGIISFVGDYYDHHLYYGLAVGVQESDFQYLLETLIKDGLSAKKKKKKQLQDE